MKRHFASYMSAFLLLKPERIKLGLETVSKLDAALGYPSRQFEVIHVAGTNGKGSVSIKIAHALLAAGKRVGLYTSPHLISFCERIWVGGECISEEALLVFLSKVEKAAEQLSIDPTFFEILTLMAFLYFAEQQVEIAVVEVGMGGRLDATNIVQPVLSVITSISYDHKEHLGETLEKIAFEKGGIIKPSVPVVVAAKIEPLSVLQKIAMERKSPLFIAEEGEDFEQQNRNTAALVLEHLNFSISEKAKVEGLKRRPSGRFELIQKEPPILLDVAHNEAGIEALLKKISFEFSSLPIVVVAAFSCAEKAKGMASFLQKRASFVYLTQANHERGVAPPVVKDCFIVPGVEKALSLAKQRAEQEGALLLVTGTFFMMPEVYPFFGIEGVRGPLCG